MDYFEIPLFDFNNMLYLLDASQSVQHESMPEFEQPEHPHQPAGFRIRI